MTANPKWPEITEALLRFRRDNPDGEPEDTGRQQSSDRPDVIARVFHKKKDALLAEIKSGLFGVISGLVYTTEFQRGACHIFIY
jgi:hypothetical protein